MSFSWNDLPLELARPLLKGSVGTPHLTGIAEIALRRIGETPPHERPALLQLTAQILQAAWEEDLLDYGAAAQVLELHAAFPFLEQPALRLARKIAVCRMPECIDDLHACLLERDTDRTLRYLENMRRSEPTNLFWLRHGLMVGMIEERLDWAERWISTAQNLPPALTQGLLADVDFARGNFRSAKNRYTTALRGLPLLVWKTRLGEVCRRNAQNAETLAHWDAVLDKRPWHTNLLLRRRDLQRSPLNDTTPPGRGVILLHTANKAACLDQTLASLAASHLADARILVLDNASADDTQNVLAIWKDRLGSLLAHTRLPCNIGATAARNWLLALPESRIADWIVFVDDDITLPTDWLALFAQAMHAYPQHPVYGCRVIRHATPLSLQSVDLHLDEGAQRGCMQGGECGQEPGHVRRFLLSTLHHQELDFGDFSYMRPCASVAGCCHLLRREALDRIGHFDLRFSPAQHDDLEHDLRYALNGQWPVYQGHLCVQQYNKNGPGSRRGHSEWVSAWANMFKLQMLHSHEDYDKLRHAEHLMLLKDTLIKALP